MGGMPVLEVSTFLPNVTSLYLTLIPTFIFFNNFLGPKRMEPVFTRDFLIAQFDKFSSSGAKKGSFTPSPGLAPKLPKELFARSAGRVGLAFGLIGLVKPVNKKYGQ